MRILFLVGPHAVGKSCFMNQLAEKYQFTTFDTGPVMRQLHKDNAPDINIKEWVEQLEEKGGPYITCSMLCNILKNSVNEDDNVIITGYRQIEGILYTLYYFNPESFEILYIDGSFDLLKNNYIAREKVEISDEDFSRYLKEEEAWGLGVLKQFVGNNPYCRYVVKESNDQVIHTDVFEKAKVLKLENNGGKNE